MRPDAIAKAKARLQKVENALEEIRLCHQINEIEPVWSDYLVAHNTIFSVLEQGAKDNPKSRQWFGGKKIERKKDPLLSYLHQARNADEHDIPSIVERKSVGSITFPNQPSGNKIISVSFTPAGGKPDVLAHDENGLEGRTIAAHVLLPLKVHNKRFRIECEPPTEHLGKPLENPRPVGIAEAGLAYVRALIAEAETFLS